MGDNLPPGVTVSDLPGNDCEPFDNRVECEGCGRPTAPSSSRERVRGTVLCSDCQERDERERKHYERQREQVQAAYERG